MSNSKFSLNEMSKKLLAFHIILVILLSLLVVYILSQDVCTSSVDYISGVGSVASLYGIAITLWQLKQWADLADVEEGKEDSGVYRVEDILLHDCLDLNLWAKVRRILEIW